MILILGSGVAGLACALAVAEAGGHAAIVTPGALSTVEGAGAVESAGAVRGIDAVLAGGNTAMAQGGIAAAVGPDDTAALHAGDTVAAGVGLVDAEAAAVLTSEGAAAVRALISAGFPADRTADGTLALGLEAAHSRSRIVHAGEDHTGAVLHEYLTSRVLGFVGAERIGAEHIGAGRIELIERTTAVSLLNDSGAVAGAVLRDADGRLSAVRSEAVVVATGGYAGLFQRTSGHPGARGEGVVLAARAGALFADLEFVQFHPTALVGTGFLVSEAVRGAGAVLRDGSGERFMASV
ncbi:MAG: FAD-binding protein, partial [Leucobacter sp.]